MSERNELWKALGSFFFLTATKFRKARQLYLISGEARRARNCPYSKVFSNGPTSQPRGHKLIFTRPKSFNISTVKDRTSFHRKSEFTNTQF